LRFLTLRDSGRIAFAPVSFRRFCAFGDARQLLFPAVYLLLQGARLHQSPKGGFDLFRDLLKTRSKVSGTSKEAEIKR
jgi:hypothetical protein